MAKLDDLVGYTDDLLSIREIEDYPNAVHTCQAMPDSRF